MRKILVFKTDLITNAKYLITDKYYIFVLESHKKLKLIFYIVIKECISYNNGND